MSAHIFLVWFFLKGDWSIFWIYCHSRNVGKKTWCYLFLFQLVMIGEYDTWRCYTSWAIESCCWPLFGVINPFGDRETPFIHVWVKWASMKIWVLIAGRPFYKPFSTNCETQVQRRVTCLRWSRGRTQGLEAIVVVPYFPPYCNEPEVKVSLC